MGFLKVIYMITCALGVKQNCIDHPLFFFWHKAHGKRQWNRTQNSLEQFTVENQHLLDMQQVIETFMLVLCLPHLIYVIFHLKFLVVRA